MRIAASGRLSEHGGTAGGGLIALAFASAGEQLDELS
jgi:hypothetical protein